MHVNYLSYPEPEHSADVEYCEIGYAASVSEAGASRLIRLGQSHCEGESLTQCLSGELPPLPLHISDPGSSLAASTEPRGGHSILWRTHQQNYWSLICTSPDHPIFMVIF